MLVINMWAGPGAGKTTTALALTALMKRNYYNVEYVSEYAKDVTYDEHFNMFEEQDYITIQQNRRLRRLRKTVEYAVTDSPIMLGLLYTPPDYYIRSFPQFLFDIHSSYDNLNIYLTRVKKYVPIGRRQTEAEALALDKRTAKLLADFSIDYHTFTADTQAPDKILALLQHLITGDIDRSIVT